MVVGLGADMAVIRRNMTRMNMTIPLYVVGGPPAPEVAEFLNLYKARHGTDRLWGNDPNFRPPRWAAPSPAARRNARVGGRLAAGGQHGSRRDD